MTELLALPFVQRALIAGVLLGALLAVLGIFVVLKRMAFLSDGVAHASLAGVAVGLLTGLNPLLTALGLSAMLGAIISWLERRTKIASDAVIGLVFTTGLALGVLLISFKKGYQPDLISFLFGNILAIQWSELYIMAAFGLVILIFLAFTYKKISLMLINQDLAHVSGVNVALYQTALYVTVALATVLGIKMLGIVLVSALLIMPVTTAKLVAKSFGQLTWVSVLVAQTMVLLGLYFSVLYDLPTGATIVLVGMGIFILTFGAQKIWSSK